MRFHRTIPNAMLGVAFALAGCAGAQNAPPIMSGSAHTQSQQRSWMLPNARSTTLVYVTTGCPMTQSCSKSGVAYAYAYPSGKLEGTLTLSDVVVNDCSDDQRNVWFTEIVDHGAGEIVKYKHGGTTAIKTLTDEQVPAGCAVDPSTGTLAVINDDFDSSYYGGVAIYPGGTGPPKYYQFFVTESTYALPGSCTYDSSGDLFITLLRKVESYPSQVIWLQKGASSFKAFYLHPDVAPREAQWDGTDLAVTVGNEAIDRFKIGSDGSGKRVGHAALRDSSGYGEWSLGDGALFAIQVYDPTFSVWRYPGGGKPVKTITGSGYAFTGITVSDK